MYDPTDEFDQRAESSGPALGEGRRQTLDALNQKDSLAIINEPDGDSDSAGFDSFKDLAEAFREISLARPDGTIYRSPPEEIVEAAESIYQALPDDAQPEYLADETLHRRINTARRRFNDWMDALRRSKKMPSPMEAGPANYPADKARDRLRRAREASEELDDALDNVKSAVRGARQRALEAIGSSVAEQNEQENRNLAERRKNRTRKGYIVLHFNGTRRGVWLPWGVKRVNQKSLRLRRPHARAGEKKDSPLSDDGETYPEYREVTVDLDSDFLIVPPAGDVSTDVLLEAVEDKPEGNTGDWEHYDTWAGYQEHLLGEDFVEGLDSYNPDEEIDQAGGTIDRAGGDNDQTAAADGGVYDPTDDMDPGETTSEVVEDITKPPGVDAANAVVNAVSEDLNDTGDSDEMEDTDESDGTDKTDSTGAETPERIEFGSRPAANEFREQYEEYVHESDDRRSKTVVFNPDTPENVLDQAGVKTTTSRQQHKKYGQAELTDAELDRLQDQPGWSWNPHGFHAQAAKALLLEEGGTPWLDYYDHTIEVDEHLSVIESGVDMAVKEGLSGPGEGRDDTGKIEDEIARDLDEAHSRMCRRAEDACEDGEEDACEALLEDCGYAEDEIAALMEATRELGESPLDVYDPTREADETTSFEEWAREQAPARLDSDEIDGPIPERPDPPTPDEPDDEELRRLAPARLEEMSGATLGVLRKAWAGYKMARAEDREAHERMDEYAEIINGIRVVNDQEPIDFDQREGWDGGPILPEDPTEEYPVGNGTRQKSLSEAIRDGVAGVIEGAQATLGDTYDPTEEF